MKVRKCRVCGVEFRVMPWSKRRVCTKCHLKIRSELVRDLKKGEGKYFEQWLEGVKRFTLFTEKAKEWMK